MAEAEAGPVTVLPFLLASYLLGAAPIAYLIARAGGVDLRAVGSGNLGGTNVYRALGPWPALLVISLDFLKGLFPVWFFPLWDGAGSIEWRFAYGGLAVAGHVWSAFTGFSGGKGVATAAGAVTAMAPLAALVGVLVWAGLALMTRIAALASLAAALIVPVVAFAADGPPSVVLFAAGLAAFVAFTHRENISRMVRGRELRLRGPPEAGPPADPGSDAESP